MARLTEHAALIAGAKIQVDAGFIRLLIKCNMDKVIQLDELGRRNQNHTSCPGIMEEMETSFILKTKTLTRNAEGFFFPSTRKAAIYTLYTSLIKAKPVEHVSDGDNFC